MTMGFISQLSSRWGLTIRFARRSDGLESSEATPYSIGVWWPSPEWSSPVGARGPSRDLCDWKRLPSHTAPVKQLLPTVPACFREAKSLWDKTLTSKIFARGTPSLDMHNMHYMEESGFVNPPNVEPSLAYHLSPSRHFTNDTGTSLPRKMESFTASIFKKTYKASAQAIIALNVTSVLLAYQAELLKEVRKQLPWTPYIQMLGWRPV